MNASEIVAALAALEPPRSLEDFPAYAAKRDSLVESIQRAVEGGARLTPAHRSGLERAVEQGEIAMRVLETRRDEVVTARERARRARRKVAEHLRRQEGSVAQRVDLSA